MLLDVSCVLSLLYARLPAPVRRVFDALRAYFLFIFLCLVIGNMTTLLISYIFRLYS